MEYYEKNPRKRKPNSKAFVIEVHHGGKIDNSKDFTYVDGMVHRWKNVQVKNFCYKALCDFVHRDLGYKNVEAINYKIPGQNLLHGIRLVLSNKDTDNMLKLVKKSGFIEIYVEGGVYHEGEEESESESEEGEVVEDEEAIEGEETSSNSECESVANSVEHLSAEESEELFDMRLEKLESKKAKATQKKNIVGPVQVECIEETSHVMDYPPENDVEHVDGSQFDTNGGYNSEYDSENYDSPIEDEEDGDLVRTPSNCEEYNPKIDMYKFKPSLRMKFANAAELKLAFRDHAVASGRGLNFKRNCKEFVIVRCKPGCPYFMYASPMQKVATYQIKTLRDKHRCTRNFQVPMANSDWLASKYHDKIMSTPKWKLKEFIKAVREKYGIDISPSRASRAMEKAKGGIDNELKKHYAMVWNYAGELKKKNPDSTVKIEVARVVPEEPAYFQRMYICFHALAKGWRDGCRPVIGLDGCFLKGYIKGELLTAIGRDGNNHMFPIAWAVVESESTDSWTWFLSYLKDNLDLMFGTGLTLISDQQKGLINAVKELLPCAEHRNCARHIYANFRKRWGGKYYKTLFWEASKASTPIEFRDIMNDLKKVDEDAHDYLNDLELRDPKCWSRAFFGFHSSCDSVENNMCETFNGCILEAREKPLIYMLEHIRQYVSERMQKKRTLVYSWDTKLSPRGQMKLDKEIEKSKFWHVKYKGDQEFEIRNSNGLEGYTVNFNSKECTCRRWSLTGIPCCHAITAIFYRGEEAEKYVAHWWTVEWIKKCYDYYLHPCDGENMWDPVAAEPPLPPKARRKPGRPKKNRRKEAWETEKKTGKASRIGRVMTCTKCGQEGHNRRGCKNVINESEAAARPSNISSNISKRKAPSKQKKTPNNAAGPSYVAGPSNAAGPSDAGGSSNLDMDITLAEILSQANNMTSEVSNKASPKQKKSSNYAVKETTKNARKAQDVGPKRKTPPRDATIIPTKKNPPIKKTCRERVPGGLGAYTSPSGNTFVRMSFNKNGYWVKKPSQNAPQNAPPPPQSQNAPQNAPPPPQSQNAPSSVPASSQASQTSKAPSVAAPTKSSLAKVVQKKSLGMKKNASNWLKGQSLDD